MAYAHQGIEIKPLPGVAPAPAPQRRIASPAPSAKRSGAAAPPTMLDASADRVLLRVERMMENAARALATAPRRSARREAGAPDAVAGGRERPRGALTEAASTDFGKGSATQLARSIVTNSHLAL